MRVAKTDKLIVAALLMLYAGVLAWHCHHFGITIDEPIRLLGAQLYWSNLPDHPPKDQPPLLSIMTGWAPRLLEIPLMRDHEIWKRAWKDHVYSFILDRLPPAKIDRLFFLSRLGVICFPILTALLIWRWSSRLFSRAVALLVFFLFLLLPCPRAHGSLITSDMAAAFTYLLSAYRGWCYWRAPSLRNAIWLGLAAGLALIAKFSLLIVPVMAAIVVGLRYASSPRLLGKAALAMLLVAIVPLMVAVAAYKFDARTMPPEVLAEMAGKHEDSAVVTAAAHILRYVPTPPEMQEGILQTGVYFQQGTPAFLLGTIYPAGHWSYYPICLALKLPVGFQLLVVAGLAVIAFSISRRKIPLDTLFLLVPAAIYLGFAMLAPIQLGIRLILPVVAFLTIIAGFAIEALYHRARGKALLAAVFAFVFISTARVFPHDLSYFNEWAGGPENGWRYLSDSNIDWGQNLPDLKTYTERHKIEKINWFPFGFDKPYRYFTQAQLAMPFSPFTPQFLKDPVFHPTPGYYAVNVSLLGGQFYDPPYRDFLKYFREREPDGRAGYGILIYHVLQGAGTGARSSRE